MSDQDKETIRDIFGKSKRRLALVQFTDLFSVYGEEVSNTWLLGFLSEKDVLQAWFGKERMVNGYTQESFLKKYSTIDWDEYRSVYHNDICWKYYAQRMTGLSIPERLKIFREHLK